MADAIKGDDDGLIDEGDQTPDLFLQGSYPRNVYVMAPASRPDVLCGGEFLRDQFILKKRWAA